ncbi:hypothetical protein [Dyella humicola]|uniref:hypothetical protein n=1 Tax=Dyella humicola TaxID=2992126 RepID=UPI00224FCB29|nr:hypothetical protein [Dyella humicola]
MAVSQDEHLKLMPNDIETYARYVEGVDPSRYYDSQERDVWCAAAQRWPLLAAVLHADVGRDVDQ